MGRKQSVWAKVVQVSQLFRRDYGAAIDGPAASDWHWPDDGFTSASLDEAALVCWRAMELGVACLLVTTGFVLLYI